MIHLLMLIVIAACLFCIIFSSWNPRKRVIDAGERGAFLWKNIQLCISSAKVRKPACLTERIAAPQKIPSASESVPQLKQVAVEVQPAQVSSGAKKKSKRGPRGEAGDVDEIQFSYPRRDGLGYETRKVSVWAVDADYLEGYCHARQGKRTFSLPRVRGKVTSLRTGEIQRIGTWASAMRLLPNNRIVTDGASHRPVGIKGYPMDKSNRKQWQTAAYFVGFRDAKRCELESMARAAGWQVHTGFSPSLNFLIAGPLAGTTQLSKAYSMGIGVILELNFKKMIVENQQWGGRKRP
ncbi:BRCT domain-containing protein [Janthinobacterium sp. BJB301]|uniref:BRCT domain-containing protein n=1 Tax=Janthinobacterium sp. BJB301 TaxID=1560195 RepID=UPI00117B0979|nr:BRCT domain-containing protein [Janthinobacterium sp. BJB301]